MTSDEAKVVPAKKLHADKSLEIDDICKTLRMSRSTFYRYVRMSSEFEEVRMVQSASAVLGWFDAILKNFDALSSCWDSSGWRLIEPGFQHRGTPHWKSERSYVRILLVDGLARLTNYGDSTGPRVF